MNIFEISITEFEFIHACLVGGQLVVRGRIEIRLLLLGGLLGSGFLLVLA